MVLMTKWVGLQCYLEMLELMRKARVVVTDSGGVQKESFFCGTPCVTCRSETEWVELVECGWNRLADPAKQESIPDAVVPSSLSIRSRLAGTFALWRWQCGGKND